MPAVVYTSPEVAVGLTKEEAEEINQNPDRSHSNGDQRPVYRGESDEGGLCKVVLEDGTNRLLGVRMVMELARK